MTKIDDYLKNTDLAQRKELLRVRKIIRQIVPDAEETISYGIPTLKYKGKNLIHFAAFKDHMSIFPASHAVEVLMPKLKEHKVSKGTIQFTASKPLSKELIKEMVQIRLDDISNEDKKSQ